MIANVGHAVAALWLQLVLVPTLLGVVLAASAHQNKRLLASLGGLWAQVVFGGLGVIVHELSHLLCALLFHHRITRVVLLRIPHGPDDLQLGSVEHSWRPDSLYQRAGNLFIGIAPLIGGTAVLLVVTRWFAPGLYFWWQALTGAGPDPGSTPPASGWTLAAWLVLAINLSLGGFDLSPADLHNAASGVVTTLSGLLVASLLPGLFWPATRVATTATRLAGPVDGALGLAIFINLTLFAVLWAIRRGSR